MPATRTAPADGEYSIWQKGADCVVTWNAENDSGYHDVACEGRDPTEYDISSTEHSPARPGHITAQGRATALKISRRSVSSLPVSSSEAKLEIERRTFSLTSSQAAAGAAIP